MAEALQPLALGRGAEVFVHQAFTCCPYAALITARIHDFLEVNGYRVGDDPRRAAASLVNTCGFNGSRASQAVDAIQRIRRMAGARPLVVCGCLTRIARARLDAAAGDAPGTTMVAPGQFERLDALFGPVEIPFGDVRTHRYNERYSARDPRLGLYQILAATGCRNECRYCVIRHAKGALDSRPLPRILEQARGAIDGGHREVFLVADDLSSWGLDRGSDVGVLLSALADLELRYSAEAFEPSRLLENLDGALPAFARGRFDWIVVPIQSGSDRVLRAMGRRYTSAEVERLLAELAAAAPEMIVSTDVIFGYPGEEEEDFQASLELAARFGFANFNEYERRPGTPPPDVEPAEIERRRRAVSDFLRQQGGQLEGLTRNRAAACSSWSGQEPVGGEPEPSPWARSWSRRLAGSVAGADGAALGGGWTLGAIAPWRREVRLRLSRDAGAEVMDVSLSRLDPDGGAFARTGEFNVSMVGEAPAGGLPADRSRGLAALVRWLGAREQGRGGEGGG